MKNNNFYFKSSNLKLGDPATKSGKGVETAFSMITTKFGKVIKATTIGGCLTKLRLFITAYPINCFLKLSDDKKALLFN